MLESGGESCCRVVDALVMGKTKDKNKYIGIAGLKGDTQWGLQQITLMNVR